MPARAAFAPPRCPGCSVYRSIPQAYALLVSAGFPMSEVIQILLVEPDREKRRLAAERLAARWPVREVGEAAACLDLLRRGGSFVVLLGLRLPDMDGRDLLARLAESHP